MEARKRPSGSRLLFILIGTLVFCYVGLRVAGWYTMRRLMDDISSGGTPLPASMKDPRVLLGVEKFAKSEFAKVPGLGRVTDIKISGSDVIVAGEEGAVTLDSQGRPKSAVLPFPLRYGPVQILLGPDGPRYFDHGWHMKGPEVYDRAGRVVWSSTYTVESAAAVDWDGKGKYDLALGSHKGGFELYDDHRKLLWRHDAANPWVMKAIRDTDKGVTYVAHSNASGKLVIAGRDGKIKKVDFGTYVHDFAQLADGPGKRAGKKSYVLVGPPVIAVAARTEINFSDLDGRPRWSVPMPPPTPDTVDQDVYDAIYVPFRVNGDYYTAVMIDLGRHSDRSALNIYHDKILVHQELLSQHAGPLAIIERPDKPGVFRLLVGGHDGVSVYEL